MVGSFSSGSIGPRPVISSMISSTKSSSSCALSAMRSASTYWATSAEICRRTSPSDTFSIAERLISSISRRCSRTFASSSLSRSGEIEGAGFGSVRASAVPATACRLGASTGRKLRCRDGAAAWRRGRFGLGDALGCGEASEHDVLSAPARACARRTCDGLLAPLAAFGGKISLLSACCDVVAGLHLVERHAAVDRLADEAEIVRDRGGERVAERLLDVGAAQAGSEQALLEAVDDHLERRPVGQALADHVDQMARVLEPRHGHLGHQEQPVRADQHAVGPGEPGARHVDHDIVEMRRHQIEQPRHHLEIEIAHLGRPARRRDHLQAGRMLGDHHLEQLPVEPLRARLDLVEVEARFEVEIVAARAVLEIEIDQAGLGLAARSRP